MKRVSRRRSVVGVNHVMPVSPACSLWRQRGVASRCVTEMLLIALFQVHTSFTCCSFPKNDPALLFIKKQRCFFTQVSVVFPACSQQKRATNFLARFIVNDPNCIFRFSKSAPTPSADPELLRSPVSPGSP